VTIAVGLFAVGETLYVASKLNRVVEQIEKIKGAIMMTKEDWKRSWKPWLRGTAIGFPFGAMPAGGAEIPTFLSYAIEKKLTKTPEEFGKGAIEGVAGPEAANNASSTGVMVPLLTLGLPTSATAAILLAAFQQYGLQPGPLLFETNPALVWGLIASFYVGNIMLLVLNLPLIGIWIKLLTVPYRWLFPAIVLFCAIGVYSTNNNVFDIWMVAIFGVIGYGFIKLGVEPAPLLLGFILGPMMEENLRRALLLSRGDWSVLVTRPLSATLLAISLLLLIIIMLPAIRKKREEAFVEE
jgi:putative tricarboxylic transport membrane protein